MKTSHSQMQEEIGGPVSLKGDWITEANWIHDRLVGSLEDNSLENEFNSIADVNRKSSLCWMRCIVRIMR